MVWSRLRFLVSRRKDLDEAERELHQSKDVLDTRASFTLDSVLFLAVEIDLELGLPESVGSIRARRSDLDTPGRPPPRSPRHAAVGTARGTRPR